MENASPLYVVERPGSIPGSGSETSTDCRQVSCCRLCNGWDRDPAAGIRAIATDLRSSIGWPRRSGDGRRVLLERVMDNAAWNVYLSLLRGGHDALARMTLRNLMAREISHSLRWLDWGPFRIGLRRWK